MMKNNIDYEKLQISNNRDKLEFVMKCCMEFKRELKNIGNTKLSNLADKAYMLSKQVYDKESVNKDLGIPISSVAKYFDATLPKFNSILRSLEVFDEKNFPTEKYKRWFYIENELSFSLNGKPYFVDRVYVKRVKLKYLERFLKKNGGNLTRWLKL